jgi:hypothetical protein
VLRWRLVLAFEGQCGVLSAQQKVSAEQASVSNQRHVNDR